MGVFRGNPGQLRIIITRDYDEMSRTAASFLAEEIRENPQAVIGLATGSTSLGTYKELIRLRREGDLDFSRIRTFNLDEYFRLPPDHPQS